MMHMYISRNTAAACLTMTTTASHSSNYMHMLYSSSVYSRAHAYAHYAALYARIRVIVVCYETRYLTPCAQPSSTWGRFHWRRSLIVYARYVCGDAPLVPSEQREYYRRRRRTSSFTSQILLRKAAACLFLRVGSYTILNRLCSKARAIFKT